MDPIDSNLALIFTLVGFLASLAAGLLVGHEHGRKVERRERLAEQRAQPRTPIDLDTRFWPAQWPEFDSTWNMPRCDPITRRIPPVR